MKHLLTVFFLAISFVGFSQDKYSLTIDLNHVVDDKVKVTILVPKVTVDTIEFQMPKIVPGTYSIANYGRFISSFVAVNSHGDTLAIRRLSKNRILIVGSSELTSISYWIDDTFDTDLGNFIFEPAGINIEEGTNFVLNNFGVVGYLKGMKDYPFELKVEYPKALFGASSLDKKSVNDSVDVFSALNYFDLVDGPIMYTAPDTISFEVGGADIMISIYSPNKVLDPAFVKEQIEPTLQAQKAYLGELPIDKYVFLIYLFEKSPKSGSMGALEHSYSSFYCLPEVRPSRIAQVIRDVAAHEFFHIVTPLNIHSEEIGDFDFINPKMSKHLWMYEGTTEYAASLAQVKYGELSLEDYLEVIEGKIKDSGRFDDQLPFTELSINCLGETKNQYGNVYQKGALIGMSLDIRLRELSDGKYGLQDLMQDLSLKYGKKQSFKDEELFDVITELTFPEIRDFFATYVEGETALPYAEILNKVGVNYQAKTKTKQLSLGHISFEMNEAESRLVISSINQMNEFGESMGYQEGDIIYKFDKVEIDIENYQEEFEAFTKRHKVGDKITAVVIRTDEKGKAKKVKLSANAVGTTKNVAGKLEINKKATPEQLALRKAWVNK